MQRRGEAEGRRFSTFSAAREVDKRVSESRALMELKLNHSSSCLLQNKTTYITHSRHQPARPLSPLCCSLKKHVKSQTNHNFYLEAANTGLSALLPGAPGSSVVCWNSLQCIQTQQHRVTDWWAVTHKYHTRPKQSDWPSL